MELFPYQVEGAKFLASRKRALLADDMGLGKSAQAIAACDALKAQIVVVICPASLVENWRREFIKFSRHGIVPFVRSYNKPPEAATVDIDVLILDEAHYLKSKDAKRTKAIFGEKCDGKGGLVERAKHVFCLTGTPTPNNASELWPMLRAVMPETIGRDNVVLKAPDCGKSAALVAVSGKPLSYWSFVQKYCKTVNNGFGIKIVGSKNTADLKQRIAPFVLRRKKDEVLKDLPPIRFDELPLQGDVFAENFTDDMVLIRKALTENGVAGLKEIAPHVASLRRVTGMAKVNAAVEWVSDWLDAGGKKLVIFAHHRDVVAQLASRFQNLAVSVTGSTHLSDRQRCVDMFQQDPNIPVFIGQIQAAGTGITLTAASDALFVESSWVPAENEQAAMRIHRIGQKNACIVRFATLAGSIDEDIQRAVMRKTADIAKLFG